LRPASLRLPRSSPWHLRTRIRGHSSADTFNLTRRGGVRPWPVPVPAFHADRDPGSPTSTLRLPANLRAAEAEGRGPHPLGVALPCLVRLARGLVIVKPETVIAWRRKKFREYWTKLPASKQVRAGLLHRPRKLSDFDGICVLFGSSSTVHLRSPSWPSPDEVLPRLFPVRSPPGILSPRSVGWFENWSCNPSPGGPPPSSMQHGYCQSVYPTSFQCLRGTLSRSTSTRGVRTCKETRRYGIAPAD
jgi:hypothetical protein